MPSVDACDAAAKLLDEFAPVEIHCERYTEKHPHPGGQEASRIHARFPWQRQPQTRVMIETAVDEKILKPAQRRKLIHEYSEPLEAEVRVYALEEILAERLRAILQHVEKVEERGWGRSRARDYYDLWRLLGAFRKHMVLSDPPTQRVSDGLLGPTAARSIAPSISLASAARQNTLIKDRLIETGKYFDSEAGRYVVVGSHEDKLVLIPYEETETRPAVLNCLPTSPLSWTNRTRSSESKSSAQASTCGTTYSSRPRRSSWDCATDPEPEAADQKTPTVSNGSLSMRALACASLRPTSAAAGRRLCPSRPRARPGELTPRRGAVEGGLTVELE